MKQFFSFYPMLLLVIASDSLFARSIEADRHVNAQGIEFIQSRSVPAPKVELAETPKLVTSIKSSIADIKPMTISVVKHGRASDFQISSREQFARDRDRIAILNQELMSETSAFQADWKTLHTPNLKAALSKSEALRLEEAISDHEKNIRALNAEIGRVRVSP